MKLNKMQELYIKNDYFIKVYGIKDKIGCVIEYPETWNIARNKVTFTYDNDTETLKIKDSNKNNKEVKIRRHVVRPAIIMDVLLNAIRYDISCELIIHFNLKKEMSNKQSLYDIIHVEMSGDETDNEKLLSQEIVDLISQEFNNSTVEGYDFLRNCSINGGLLL